MIPALGGKRVELNVYDLQDANSFSASAGVGIYHTGNVKLYALLHSSMIPTI